MNPETWKQLNKVTIPLPSFNEDTETLLIPRQLSTAEVLKIGFCYLIKVAPYITNPPSNFTLAENWNKGVVPKCEYMKIEVINIQGNMVQVNAFGYDYINKAELPFIYPRLWLPFKAITVQEIY